MAPRQTSANLALARDPFTISDEIRDVARQVIADNNGFRQLNEITIQYLLNNKAADEDLADGIDGIVRAVKAPPIWRFLSDVEVVVWVVEAYWRIFSAEQRAAVVTHALSHVQIDEDDKGEIKIKIVGHDVEEFHRVAMQFGSWTESVRRFALAIATQRGDAQAVQVAVDDAIQQLDGTEIVVDPESGAKISTARGRKGRGKSAQAVEGNGSGEALPPVDDAAYPPDATPLDENAGKGDCGVQIADGVVCTLDAFHSGPHAADLPADPTPLMVEDAPAAPTRPRKGGTA